VGKMQRNKGRLAESAVKRLLQDRDWTICDLSAGCNDADLLAIDPDGKTWLVEVKNHKLMKVLDWRKQASEQAAKKKLPWMLVAKVPGSACWLVWRQGMQPIVFHEKEIFE
jgi:hypothetical protein